MACLEPWRNGLAAPSATVTNTILWNGGDEIGINEHVQMNVTYSDIHGHWPGIGNIDADPLFAEPGHWDSNDTPDDASDDVWIDGDYHLKSQAGRWDPNGARWVQDDVSSPCIDAGDPNSDFSGEVWPHGERINMGAYGGTIEASLSAEPVEMFLPRIACIYWENNRLARSCQSFLQAYGCPATLIRSDDLLEQALDDYDLIMIATDTPSPAVWADEQAFTALVESSQPIIGLGEGGYRFFGKLGLAIGYPNGASGSFDSVQVVDPNSSLFGTPYPVTVPEDGVLKLYRAAENSVMIYLWPAPDAVTMLGGVVGNSGYYPLVAEQGHLLWGFAESPEHMTEMGRRLFLNAVILTANARLEPETAPTP